MARELVPAKTRVTPTTLRRLERLARREGRSVASELRIAIESHLAKNGKGGQDGG